MPQPHSDRKSQFISPGTAPKGTVFVNVKEFVQQVTSKKGRDLIDSWFDFLQTLPEQSAVADIRTAVYEHALTPPKDSTLGDQSLHRVVMGHVYALADLADEGDKTFAWEQANILIFKLMAYAQRFSTTERFPILLKLSSTSGIPGQVKQIAQLATHCKCTAELEFRPVMAAGTLVTNLFKQNGVGREQATYPDERINRLHYMIEVARHAPQITDAELSVFQSLFKSAAINRSDLALLKREFADLCKLVLPCDDTRKAILIEAAQAISPDPQWYADLITPKATTEATLPGTLQSEQ